MSYDATGMLTPEAVASIDCPVCNARAGSPCVVKEGDYYEWDTHCHRIRDFREGLREAKRRSVAPSSRSTVVHKYILEPGVIDTLQLPRGAHVLCVHEQRGAVCLWAAHEPPATTMESRSFAIMPTGIATNLPGNARYIGTVFISNATLVFHVYEVPTQ